jgi:hypothetical protein
MIGQTYEIFVDLDDTWNATELQAKVVEALYEQVNPNETAHMEFSTTTTKIGNLTKVICRNVNVAKFVPWV